MALQYDDYGNPIGETEDPIPQLPSAASYDPTQGAQPDITANPMLLASILSRGRGGAMPDFSQYARAGNAMGINQSPAEGSPLYHPYIQSMMQAGETQPAVDATQQYAQDIAPYYDAAAGPPPAKPEKPSGLKMLLSGLSDAVSAYGALSHPHRQKYRLLGRKHERYISGPSQDIRGGRISSNLAQTLFGPQQQYKHEMKQYGQRQAAAAGQMAPQVARFAAQQMAQPRETPQAGISRFLSSVDPSGKLTNTYHRTLAEGGRNTGSRSAAVELAEYVRNLTPEQRKQYLDMKREEAAITRTSRAPAAGRMTPQEKADAAGLVLKRKIKVMRDQGLIGPDQHRTATAITSHYGPQITQLQAELAALNKEARAGNYTDPQTGAIGPDPMTLNRINVKQRQLNDLQAKRQSALDAVLRSSGVNVESFLNDTAEQPALEGDGATGADMGDPELPDGSRVSEWEPEDWDALQASDPTKFDQYQAIAQGASQ